MEKAKVIFNLEGVDVSMQCSTEDRMKDICQKFATKVQKSFNSLVFLYGGSQLDFNLKVREQDNSLDKERKEKKRNENISIHR